MVGHILVRFLSDVIDRLQKGRITFTKAINLVFSRQDIGKEIFPITETLIQIGRMFPEDAINEIPKAISFPNLRHRELYTCKNTVQRFLDAITYSADH